MEEKKSLLQIAAEFWDDIPEEERAKMPTDGAENHDHYLYGWPKRSEQPDDENPLMQTTSPPVHRNEVAQSPAEKSIFETILEGMERDIPESEWAKLPTDGAENHDHYLYGSPKKNDAQRKEAA